MKCAIVHLDDQQRALARALGERVRREREIARLRQDELAFAAGVSTRVVHQVEAGKPTTRLDGLMRILNALGLTIEIAVRPLRREAPLLQDPDDE